MSKKEVTKDEMGVQLSQKNLVELADTEKLQLLRCPICGGMHFRHAGYMLPLLPFLEKGESKVQVNQAPVYICINCKAGIIHVDGKIHDVSGFVDMSKWEQTEKLAYKMTGPGGQC